MTVTATPAAVTFTYQAGATTLPAAQAVSVKPSAGTPAYSVAVTPVNPPSNALWLTVSPLSGNLPATLSVRVNPTTMPVGAYSATVAVTVTGVTNPVNITVNLNVTAAPSSLTVSPGTLTFTYPSATLSQTLTLSTNGAPISYTATSGSAWLTVLNGSGSGVGVVLPGDPVALTVTVNAASLVPQAAVYVGKITIVASGAAVTAKSQNVTVNLTVNSSTPTISTIWPSSLPVNGGDSTVTVVGTNFFSGSASNQTLAKLQGVATALKTTVLSATQLLAVVPAASLLSAGTLNIYVENPAPGGSSNSKAITVASTPTIAGVVGYASWAAGPISPGELVAIFGNNIGPAAPAPMSITNGYVDTTLSGVSVTIDGKDAPIIFASANQVNVQVPYEVGTGNNKQVSVTNGSNPAATATVTIAATAPAIFTADGSGASQAAALNYSVATSQYSFNSGTSPAKIGDTVLLYLTGEGDYNSTPLDPNGTTNTGYIIPSSLSPLPEMNPLPTVTIGGADATVSYAGPIAGSILGLLQINAVVPAGSTTGAAVPVVVTVGNNSTQINVTVAIHQ